MMIAGGTSQHSNKDDAKLQAWLDKAVALRVDMLQSEARFFMFLIEGENGACPWRGQYTTFEQFLETTNLCTAHRYTSFRDSLKNTNGVVSSNIETLGVDGVIEAARIEAVGKRKEFVTEVVERTKAQGCPLSPRRMKEIGQRIEPKKRPHRRESKSYEQLLKENGVLREENTRLKAENKELKDQLKRR